MSYPMAGVPHALTPRPKGQGNRVIKCAAHIALPVDMTTHFFLVLCHTFRLQYNVNVRQYIRENWDKRLTGWSPVISFQPLATPRTHKVSALV